MMARWSRFVASACMLVAFGLMPSAAGAAEGKKPGPDEPSPQTRTFFIEGVKTPADVKAITDSVMKVKSVTAVEDLTPENGRARVSFDHHAVTHHQIAQAIADAGSFKVSFKVVIPDYAANAEKIDAIFARVADQVRVEATDREKGEFTLWFLPLPAGEPGPRGIGFNLGRIGHAIGDPPPKGLGLKTISVTGMAAKAPAKKAPAKKVPAKKAARG